MKEILDRILRESGVAHLVELLAERLAPTDLQSLLLEVFRQRAARQTPAHLLDQYEHGRFVRPAATDPRALVEFDRLAFTLASPPFEPIDLSPVCPLGANSVVALISQNVAVATIRNTEVVSDSTNVLALECALRRRAALRARARARDRVRLCASHRLLRAQHYDRPGLLAHFRLFGLCTAGRDEGAYRFELEALTEQLSFYLALLAACHTIGHPIGDPRVAITDLSGGIETAKLQADVIEPLSARFPHAGLEFDPARTSGRGYYEGVCFNVYGRDRNGVEHQLVDGGFTPWTQKLLSNRKERLLISGIGTERVCRAFCG